MPKTEQTFHEALGKVGVAKDVHGIRPQHFHSRMYPNEELWETI